MARLKLFIPLIIFCALGIVLYRGLALDPQRLPSALIGKAFPEFELPGHDPFGELGDALREAIEIIEYHKAANGDALRYQLPEIRGSRRVGCIIGGNPATDCDFQCTPCPV